MKKMRVASLVPGRVRGAIETNPTRSGSSKILLLRQEQLPDVSALPGGLILVEAVPFSHPVIHWLESGIPMALIDAEQAARWEQGTWVLLDSACGEMRDQKGDAKPKPWHAPVTPKPGEPVTTADGAEIQLSASIGSSQAGHRAVLSGAAAIGLVRSEYLVPDDTEAPNREFYRRVFSELLTLTAPLTVTIRLIDLAADKWPPWLAREHLGDTLCNLHGSQLYSYQPVQKAAEAQLAGLQDIGAKDRLRLLWPSGGRLDDFTRWRAGAESLLPPTIPLGAMAETPIELLALSRWGSEADFVSVGCNDLLANLCGANRDDPRLRDVLDPYRPELYRFLGECADQAGTTLKRVQLCGLLPQIEGVLSVLIGLGYRHFSGEPALIPLLSRCVTKTALKDCTALAAAVCAAADSREVRELMGLPVELRWGLVRDNIEESEYRSP